MKPQDLVTNARRFYDSGSAFEFVGPPGIGKSTVVREACRFLSESLATPFGLMISMLSGIDSADVRGLPFPRKDDAGGFYTQFSRPPVFPGVHNIEIYENGELVVDADRLKAIGMPRHGVIFYDEFGQADTDVQKVAAQIILDKRKDEHRLPAGWVIWMASNRMSDKSGVVKQLSFLQNRKCTIEIEPDYDGFERFSLANGVNGLAISFAKRHPGLVWKPSVPSEPGPFLTARALVLCAHNLEVFRPEGMPLTQLPTDDLAKEIIYGWMGQGDGAVFIEHLALGASLPDPRDVLENPDTAIVPDRIDAKFVMVINMALTMTSQRRSSKRVKAALTYISRFPEDLQVTFVASVLGRSVSALATPEFTQWVARNQKLVLAARAG